MRKAILGFFVLIAPLAWANEPYLVKDINTHIAPSSSYPDHFVTIGNYAFFNTTDYNDNPREIWRSDGTEPGTIFLHAADSKPVVFQGKAWFTSGGGLWSSDGTVAGTQQLTLPVVSPVLNPKNLMATSSALYFYADWYQSALWTTDGTTAGTHRVGNATYSSPYSYQPDGFILWAALGPSLCFVANDGNGFALWRTDGTTITQLDPPSASYYWSNLQSFGNVITYEKLWNGGSNQQQYWRTDGTVAGTYQMSANGTPLTFDGYFRRVLSSGGWLWFVANDGNGRKLFRSNGTPAGTTVVATSLPGSSATFDGYLYAALANGPLIFGGPAVGSGGDMGLWVYDGNTSTFLSNVTAGNNAFLAVSAGSYVVYGAGGTLWRTDGTIGGTYSLGTTNGSDGYHNWPMAALGTTILMGASDSTYGYELWKTDGTVANTGLLKDVLSTTYSSYPNRLTRFKNGVLFFANSNATSSNSSNSTELWFSDGTNAGTQQVFNDGSYSWELVPCGNVAYFTHETQASGHELWITDGSAAGTFMLDLYPGTTGGYPNSSGPGFLRCVDTTLYFSARDAGGTGLWRSDGTAPGTYKIKSMTMSSSIAQMGHGFVFLSDDDHKLWASNGTAEGTVVLKNFTGSEEVFFSGPLSAGSYAYLSVGYHTYNLWRTDGTAAGTTTILPGAETYPIQEVNRRALLIYPGYCTIGDAGDRVCFDPYTAGSGPFNTSFKMLNGRLYYNKPNLYSTDLANNAVDTGLIAYNLFAVAGGRLYMNNEIYATLQESDGTVAGTRDLALQMYGDKPEALGSAGRLFITTDELYAYDLPVAAVSMSPASVPTTGGQVTINGRGFAGPVTVTVGESAAAVGTTNDTTITFTAPAHDPGAYKVTFTTGDGRTIDADAPLVYTCSAPAASINSTPGPVCPMVPVHLQGSGGTQCHWYPADGLDDPGSCTPTVTVSKTITYTLAVQNASGCMSANSPSVTVTIFAPPDPTITLQSGQFTPGNSYTASVPDAGPGATYQWSATGVTIVDPTLRTITFQTGCSMGKLYVAVTNGNGCGTSSSADVYVYSPVSISNVSPVSYHPGSTLTITGSNFTCVNSVKLGGTLAPAAFEIVNATTIRAQVPATTTSGYVWVSTPSSTARSRAFYLRLFRDDMTGDGRSDIVWRKPSTGETLVWYIDQYSGLQTMTPFVRQAGTTDYKVVGIHELWGYQSQADILWQRTSTGELSTTYTSLSYQTPIPEKPWPVIPPPTLKVAAMGDLDGNGFGEAIMRDTQSGATSLWYFDSVNFTQTPIHSGNNLDWDIVAARDFDFDGKDDILWRNKNSGATLIWFMDGATIRSSQWIHSGGNLDWTIAGVGDFDSDGKADILWRYNPTGATLMWQMNGGQIVSSTWVHYGGNLNWTVAAIGDYDGDFRSDVLWRENATGRTLYWRMGGPQILSSVDLNPGGNLEWEIQAPR